MLEEYEGKKNPNAKYKKIQIKIPEGVINAGIVYNNNEMLNFSNVAYDTEDVQKLLKNEE